MRPRPIAFACAHHCAATTRSGGRYARVQATSMAEADLRGMRVILNARACAVDVNAELAK
jgi:hypothetical protein